MDKLVLLVEDELFIALDLQQTIEDAGFRVEGPCTSVDEAQAAIGVSSKLTSDRSPGTDRPRSRARSSVASAIWSLLAMIAVGGSALSSSACAAARPDA